MLIDDCGLGILQQ